MADELTALTKQNEAIVLGMAAVVEQLQKMNGYFEKADDDEEEWEEEDEDMDEDEDDEEDMKMSKAALVKEISAAVLKQVKAGLIDLHGDEAVKAKKPADASGDKEVKVDAKNETESAQKVIQAMQKDDDYDEDKDEKEDEGSAEYPMKEARFKEMVNRMSKALDELKAENASIKKSVDSQVKSGVEKQLRKMGWREEKSVVGQKSRILDSEPEVTPLKKADELGKEEFIDELAKLPWSKLAEMKEKSSMKLEGGIPEELIRKLS